MPVSPKNGDLLIHRRIFRTLWGSAISRRLLWSARGRQGHMSLCVRIRRVVRPDKVHTEGFETMTPGLDLVIDTEGRTDVRYNVKSVPKYSNWTHKIRQLKNSCSGQ